MIPALPSQVIANPQKLSSFRFSLPLCRVSFFLRRTHSDTITHHAGADFVVGGQCVTAVHNLPPHPRQVETGCSDWKRTGALHDEHIWTLTETVVGKLLGTAHDTADQCRSSHILVRERQRFHFHIPNHLPFNLGQKKRTRGVNNTTES